MNIVFMGTPEFSLPTLHKLYESDHDILLVVTQPDRPKGRGRESTPPPVKQFALGKKIPVLQPIKCTDLKVVKTLGALNADVFISVHANAAPRRGAHGIETYYLGSGHSEEAKATAARENGKLVKSVKDDQTQEILASMISTTKINKSSRLASSIQNQLYQSMRKKYSGIKNLGVKEGPFFVLHDTNMASILVEVGFVTNLREESRLKQSSYLDRLASSIAKGIAKFVQDFDPMI